MTESLLQATAELARLTGDAAMRHYKTSVAVETKADGSPVTRADRDAERIAREWLAERFPNDGIIGEEFGTTAVNARRRWIIDPIDGTKSFIRGVPLWGTLIAVCEDETTLAGAAYFPAVGEIVAAARGEGCWWNDSRCRVSETANLADATVLATDAKSAGAPDRLANWNALAQQAQIARTWGDAFGYLLVATGRADVMLDAIANSWDAAPFVTIIEEAGGVFTDWRGRRTAFGGDAIATNAALAVTARQALSAGLPQ